MEERHEGAATPTTARIPAELVARNQWVIWHEEPRTNRRGEPVKPAKVPSDPEFPDRRASVSEPATWGTFLQAYRAAGGALVAGPPQGGVSYVLASDDPFTAIDLDGCVTEDAEGRLHLAPWAQAVVNELPTYWELSPSGTGLHGWVLGKLPPGCGHKVEIPGSGAIEVYDRLRAMTVTGLQLARTPRNPMPLQEELERFVERTLPPRPELPPPAHPLPPSAVLTDAEVIERCERAAWAERWRRLYYGGDLSDYSDDHSRADLGLLDLMAFFTQDPAQLEALFSGSALGARDKWQKRADYRRRTIAKAIAGVKQPYDPHYRSNAPAPRKEPPRKEPPARAEELAPPPEETKAPEFLDTPTLEDLLAREFDPLRWAVNDLIPEGLTLLVGGSKLGKSWLGLGICLAVIQGGVALGQFGCSAGRVLYLALEDTERRLKTRVQKLMGSHTVCGEALRRFHYRTEWPRIGGEGGLNALKAWLRAHPDTRLVVVDILAAVKPRRERGGDVYAEDYDLMRDLQRTAHEFRTAILVVHHSNKRTSEDTYTMVSGSMGLPGGADGVLFLARRRGEHDGTLEVSGRDVDGGRYRVLFDPHVGTWVVDGDADELAKSRERQEVLDLLLQQGPMRPAKIASARGCSQESTRQILRRMLIDGEIGENSGVYYARQRPAN